MASSKKNMIGSWAFLIGVVLAVVLGALGQLNSQWTAFLVLIGLVVGLLNVAEHETTPFLMAGVVLIIASRFGGDVMSDVSFIGPIFNALLVIFVPATIVVAVKHVFTLARH